MIIIIVVIMRIINRELIFPASLLLSTVHDSVESGYVRGSRKVRHSLTLTIQITRRRGSQLSTEHHRKLSRPWQNSQPISLTGDSRVPYLLAVQKTNILTWWLWGGGGRNMQQRDYSSSQFFYPKAASSKVWFAQLRGILSFLEISWRWGRLL